MDLAKQNAVVYSHVSFSYPKGVQALKNIHFTLQSGQRLGIIGPNGAGKSTLLLLLNGVLTPQQGEICIRGQIVNSKNEAMIKTQVGLVFQNPEDQLFCPTVFEDVAFGPLNFGRGFEQTRRLVKNALSEVGLSDYEYRSTLNLSFGEKKLVAIATVLSTDPAIVALDEPSGNLDALHRRKIIHWIQSSKRTFLITSHDLDLLYDTCDHVLLLNKGEIIALGEAKEILTDQKLLEENDLELPLRFQ